MLSSGFEKMGLIFCVEFVHLVHSHVLKCLKGRKKKKKKSGVNQHEDGPLTIHMSFSYGNNKWGWCDSYFSIDGPSKCVQYMPLTSI